MINNIIYAIAEMFGVFAIGAVARHWKYIEEKDLTDWSKFTMDFLFPLLIFASIIKDFKVERFSELWILPVIGFGLMLFGAIVGGCIKFGLKSKAESSIFFTNVAKFTAGSLKQAASNSICCGSIKGSSPCILITTSVSG
jgi:predicted permease